MTRERAAGEVRLLISDLALPHVPMQRDTELLGTLKEPLLHCYSWSAPTLTYGYFARPDHLLHLDQLERYGWHAARRPTGGGVIFHVSDFTFSLFIPHTHPHVKRCPDANYAWINALVLKAVAPFFALDECADLGLDLAEVEERKQGGEMLAIGQLRPTFCMATLSRYDLIVGQKKIGGAAQRQTRDGLLHQGSIYLADPPFEIIQDVVKNGKEVVEVMRKSSLPLLAHAPSKDELQSVRRTLSTALYDTFKACL